MRHNVPFRTFTVYHTPPFPAPQGNQSFVKGSCPQDSIYHIWSRDHGTDVWKASPSVLATLGSLQLWQEEMFHGVLQLPLGVSDVFCLLIVFVS